MKYQPVRQHGGGEPFDIVRKDIIALSQYGERLSCPHEAKGAARACAEIACRVIPCRPYKARNVVSDRIGDVYLPPCLLEAGDLIGRRYCLEVLERVVFLEPSQDRHFFVVPGIPEADAKKEPVELGLRQGKSALEVDRVLRCHDEKRVGQGICPAVHGDLPLFHALEKARLGPRYRSVDLVGEKHMGHDRAELEDEFPLVLVVHIEPGYVRRQKIGRELHPLEARAHAFGK